MTEAEKMEMAILVEDVVRYEQVMACMQHRNTFGKNHAELTQMRMEEEIAGHELRKAERALQFFRERVV